MSRGTAQGILLVVVCGTDNVLRTVRLPIVLVPGFKRNIFSTSAAAQNGVKTIIEKNGSSLDVGTFSIQLTRLDSVDHLDLKIAKESRRTETALCAISGEKLGKESVLTALVPKKPVAQSLGSTNINQRVLENPLVEDKTKSLTYKIQESTNEVSRCEKIKVIIWRFSTIDDNGRKGCKTSEVSALKQIRTSFIVSNIEGRTSSDCLIIVHTVE